MNVYYIGACVSVRACVRVLVMIFTQLLRPREVGEVLLISVSVCLFVCLSTGIFLFAGIRLKPHLQISRNFMCVFL